MTGAAQTHDSLARSSFSLPSFSTSAASCCTSGKVNKNASVSSGEDSRSFRNEAGYAESDGNCCKSAVDMSEYKGGDSE